MLIERAEQHRLVSEWEHSSGSSLSGLCDPWVSPQSPPFPLSLCASYPLPVVAAHLDTAHGTEPPIEAGRGVVEPGWSCRAGRGRGRRWGSIQG